MYKNHFFVKKSTSITLDLTKGCSLYNSSGLSQPDPFIYFLSLPFYKCPLLHRTRSHPLAYQGRLLLLTILISLPDANQG